MNDSGNLTSIILSLIALLVVQAGAIIWFAKWFAAHYGQDMKAHTKAAIQSTSASNKLARAVDKNTDASITQTKSNSEVLTFMKALNGKLAKATIQTVKEQHVEHQEVAESVINHKVV